MRDKVIMVLDDEPGVAKYCRTTLEMAGFEVIDSMDARRAVGFLEKVRVDLLLVDIQMPHMDGFQVMEQARRAQPDLAILIMTGYGTMETATRALRMGANGLLLKPFSSARELVDDVERVLSERDQKSEIVRLGALRPLLAITEDLFKETDQDKLIDVILDAITTLMESPHAGFYRRELQPDGTIFLRLVAQRGEPLPGEPIGFEGGPVAAADAWGTHVPVDPEVVEHQEMFKRVSAHGLGAVVCAPALRRSGDNSVILAGRDAGAQPYTEADVELFSILANQAGIALQNTRLLTDLQASLDRLKQQQRALLQNEKMAAIGRLTASIAHEVNNPLQAVRNCLHLITRDDLVLEKRSEYLVLAQDELQRLMDTVQQMLDFYRPSPSQREPVDVNALVQTVLSLLSKQLQQSEIKVETRLAKGLPLLYLFRNQIQQVFFNVVLNSMEAMPDGGRIKIRTALRPDAVEVLIEDDGPGVPEETRRQLFEPFVSSKPNGTGLGLSVCYTILDSHGGTIELVEANGAAGAAFRVALPLTEVV
ncbi:MAG TPA: response regulator [Anaerolineales bacterium]|nr:response regulator [Anaerolineales bacterium]